MSTIRNRTKDQLPMVLLTLLSIVQALALELWWAKILSSPQLYAWGWAAALAWVQACTSFLGIVVIWVVYANTAIRFRWTPSVSDSIYPFLVGVCEFVLLEMHSTERFGSWFLCLAVIYALMSWVSHSKMRRARRDSDNDEFFALLKPATIRDFYPAFGIVFSLLLAGTYLTASGDRGFLALLAALAAFAFLVRQLATAARFWAISLGDPSRDAVGN